MSEGKGRLVKKRPQGRQPMETPGSREEARKALAVRAGEYRKQGLSFAKIAMEMGVSRGTVEKLLKHKCLVVGSDKRDEITVTSEATTKKLDSAEWIAGSKRFLSAALSNPEALVPKSPNDVKALVIAGATAVDKARLISGESTSNVFSLVSLQMQADKVSAAPADRGEVIDVTPVRDGATVPREDAEK